MRDNLIPRLVAVFLISVVLFPALVSAQTVVTKQFDHQLLVNTPPQSWEHVIELPESMAMKGQIFVKRNLALLGKLVIEKEEFKPTFYYVKVKLPKHFEEPVPGFLTGTLDPGDSPSQTPVLEAPSKLKIHELSAARKPIFCWDGPGKFAGLSLFDVTRGQTIWERVIVAFKGVEYDEGFLPVGHHYKWAVRQSDESGEYSKEIMSGFKIIEQNGTVIIVSE